MTAQLIVNDQLVKDVDDLVPTIIWVMTPVGPLESVGIDFLNIRQYGIMSWASLYLLVSSHFLVVFSVLSEISSAHQNSAQYKLT